MKILSEQNKSNLLANGSNQNIIVSLNLDTKIEKSLSLNNEPVHYCFLLDISDSSQNNNECNIENSKLNKIKVVLKSFVENTLPLFRDEDKISLVVYNKTQYKIVYALGKNDEKEICARIDYFVKVLTQMVEAGTLDNKYNSISKALKATREDKLDTYGFNKNKIVVITDTKPSFCMDDFGMVVDREEDALNEAAIIASKNIALDCICLSNDTEEEQGDYNFAQKLVQAANGKAYIVEDIDAIKTNLSYSIKDSHESSRYNARLTLYFNSGVDVGDYYSMYHGNKYFGKMNIQQPNEIHKHRYFIIGLPELKDNTMYNFTLDVKVPTIITQEDRLRPGYKDPKQYPIILAKVEYDTMVDGKLIRQVVQDKVVINITEDIILAQQGIRGKIETQYKMLTIKKLEPEFIKANNECDHKKLRDLGSQMSRLYLEIGKHREAEDVKRYFMKAVNEKKLKTSEINNLVKTSSTVVIGTVEKIKNPFDDMIKNG